MVLWEITVATAYFLGLRRTYKYALRIQRRLVGPDRPEIRRFLHRRTRMVFDVAVKVHQSIQQRDLEVGRNLGNWILRWLDHVKPSAQIRVEPRMLPTNFSYRPVHAARSARPIVKRRPIFRIAEHVKRGRSFFTPWNLRMRTFPSIGMMINPLKHAGLNGQYRHLSCGPPNFPAFDHRTVGAAKSMMASCRHEGGVFRKDIAQWMHQNS